MVFRNLRRPPHTAPEMAASSRLEQVSETHRRLLGFSASEYRMWLVGFRRSADGSGWEKVGGSPLPAPRPF